MNSVLVRFHCGSNVGYAMAPLERTFYEMAPSLYDGDASRVHFAYKHMDRGPSPSMPAEFHNYVVMDSTSTDPTHHAEARQYIRKTDIKDWHIVLCGNKGAESTPYEAMLSGKTRGHVTFAGYRNDLDRLQRGCYAAVIASSGWDSFPRSGMEMQATGLPLLASDLIGLREAIEDGVSGFLFRTGDGGALAEAMEVLLNDPSLRDRLSRQARERIEESRNSFLSSLLSCDIKSVHPKILGLPPKVKRLNSLASRSCRFRANKIP